MTGESVLGPVALNFTQIPRILLGGSTGSGKEQVAQIESKLSVIVRQGRFLMHGGTIFQAYLFDENSI